MLKNRVTICLEEGLLKTIDLVRGHIPRSVYIELILKGSVDPSELAYRRTV